MTPTLIELPPTALAPRQARDAVQELAGGLDAEGVFDLRVVVSELVTNSVVYGPNERIHLRIELSEAGLSGEVQDEGAGADEVRAALSDPKRRGFGLRIVDSLVDEWGVYEESTHVWFRMDRRT